MAEVFSQEWREEHAREGDRLLAILEGWDADASASAALIAVATTAAMAQAHYDAANVRAKPAGAALRLAERNVLDAAEALVGDWDAERGTTGAPLKAAIYALQRQRAASGPAELRTRTPYVIPGVEGVWEIRGMTTTDMGRGEPTELQLFRVDR